MSDKSDEIKSTMDIVQRCESYFAKQDFSKLLAIHFLICSIGLVAVSMFVAGLLATTIHLPEHLVTNLYPWAQRTAGVSKIITLLQYVLPVMVMFVYYPFVLFLSNGLLISRNVFHSDQFPRMWVFYLVSIATNAGLLLANKDRPALMGVLSLLWVLLFLWFPLSVFLNRWLTIPIFLWFPLSVFLNRWLTIPRCLAWGIAICILIANYCAVFVPLITEPMIIGQDYVNVSERTILKSGKVVDNLDFINGHQLNGLQLYDPRKSTAGTMVKVEDCQELYQILIARNKTNKRKFDCDMNANSLIVKTPFVLLEENTFKGLIRESADSDEEKDFISRNSEDKLENQKKRGWFFFHHGYNFGPMSALSLGASPEKQTMVYGWLSTVTQGKILESLGMLSYQGYFKVFFSLYIIYFIIFLFGIWLIYKNIGTVAFAGTLAVSAILVLGVELIKLAPGFNPVRHFFDVPVFYLLYRYLLNKRKAYLFAATALSLFAILWSKDFGLFITISVGVALIVYGVSQKPIQRLPFFMGAITAATGMLLYFYPMPGANPTSIYMILGVGSPLVTAKEIFNLITLVGALLLATIWIKQNTAYKILTLGMALYVVQSLTYYIWYPELHHLWGMAPIFILWLVALYHGWVSQCHEESKTANLQVLVFIMLLLFVYVPASVHFTKDRKTYMQQFDNHQLYQWTFDRWSFASTMNPSLFEDAVNLIKQYSSNNSIYIISKYDHVLPILAGRYSAMPYNELMTNLVSPREAAVAATAILEDNPRYLFVDSDIGNNFTDDAQKTETADIAAEHAAVQAQKFYGEAVARERLLGVLNEVFLRVADKYEKCETGGLISVYCRKIN